MTTVAIQDTIFFSIKKCGEDHCKICKPPQIPKEQFQKLKHFPDPMNREESHYISFAETSEKTDRLSHNNQEENLCLLHQVSST